MFEVAQLASSVWHEQPSQIVAQAIEQVGIYPGQTLGRDCHVASCLAGQGSSPSDESVRDLQSRVSPNVSGHPDSFAGAALRRGRRSAMQAHRCALV